MELSLEEAAPGDGRLGLALSSGATVDVTSVGTSSSDVIPAAVSEPASLATLSACTGGASLLLAERLAATLAGDSLGAAFGMLIEALGSERAALYEWRAGAARPVALAVRGLSAPPDWLERAVAEPLADPTVHRAFAWRPSTAPASLAALLAQDGALSACCRQEWLYCRDVQCGGIQNVHAFSCTDAGPSTCFADCQCV